MYSVIIPVYRNADFVPMLMAEFARIADMIRSQHGISTEFVFVVDASPDDSYALLQDALASAPFPSQLILHARNFGSFAAIRTGLHAAHGDILAVIAADLQEPPELLIRFLEELTAGGRDVVVGVREGRDDPALSRTSAGLFWSLYRRLVMPEVPAGGVDVFGCTRRVRDELLRLKEAHSSLVGLVFWLGFRRGEVAYHRRARAFGRSAWTMRKKVVYLLDSIFAFTDLPIRLLTLLGLVGTSFAVLFGLAIIILRLIGDIQIPGYAATVTVIAFFGALNTFGLGLVGAYAWRAYENTKQRPLAVVQSARMFKGSSGTDLLTLGAEPTHSQAAHLR